jgi:hypothetical protein
LWGFYASETVQYRHLGFICDISKNKFGFLKVEVVKSMKESMHFFGFALLVIFVDRNSLNKSHMFEDTKGVIKVRIWKKNKNTKMIYKTLHRKHKIEEQGVESKK